MIKHFLTHFPTLPFPLKALLILTSGVILLRFAGKRSITQMTVPEVIFMIAIGTILIQPLGFKNEWQAVYGGALLTIGLVLLAKLEFYSPLLRKWIFGVPSVVIKNGKMMIEELKKAKITTDDLEMRLRMEKIMNIDDVELGILEPSGRLSVTLKPEKAPATKGDIQKLMDMLTESMQHKTKGSTNETIPPLFQEAYEEAKTKEYDLH